nr:type IV toxin-antitoxin system AbiEi family antitoxin domain-containing protein [Salsipaludibacter albus]
MVPESPDAALRLVLQRQAGVFTLAQAVDCGVSASVVRRRHDRGWYDREAHGVYRDRAVPRGDRTRRFVALLSVGRQAVLARQTAGMVHGLSSTPPTSEVHLVVGCTCPHVRSGVRVHRSLTLRAEHVTDVAGHPVTTAARTLADLAAVCGPVRLRRLVAESVRRTLATPEEIRTVMRQMGRFRGKVALRALLDELSPLEVVSRSALESEFLSLTTAAGIPPTAMNHPVVDIKGRQRFIDAVYVPPKLPVELDSQFAHGSLLDWHDDRRRENDITIRGWLPFKRYNWFDVTRRGHLVVTDLKDALAHYS